MTNVPATKHHRIRLLFIGLALVSVWRFVQRPFKQDAEASQSQEHEVGSLARKDAEQDKSLSHEPEPEPAARAAEEKEPELEAHPESDPAPPAEKDPEPQMRSDPEPKPSTRPVATGSRRQHATPELDPAELRYAVKWVDSSDGADVGHEKRDLTLKQAQREAGWLAKHNRRFYPGEASERSPFSRLQVWVQCLCGRDVHDLREPHTVPGEDRICPHSDSGLSHSQDAQAVAPMGQAQQETVAAG